MCPCLPEPINWNKKHNRPKADYNCQQSNTLHFIWHLIWIGCGLFSFYSLGVKDTCNWRIFLYLPPFMLGLINLSYCLTVYFALRI
jgi:hypothetical protein